MVTLKLSRSKAGRLQKVVIRHSTGEDLEGCCLVYLALFGERVLFPSHVGFSESVVMAPAVAWGLKSCLGTFFL